MKIPLVCISGLLSNEVLWAHQIKHLSDIADIRVISPNQDTPQKMVQAILAQAPKQFALAGHSMGGWLCLEVMRKASVRVSKLCLLNTTAKSDSLEKMAKRKQMIERVKKGQFQEVVHEIVDLFVFNSNVKADVEKMFLAVGAKSFIQQENSMLIRDECESILPKIGCPTLVVHSAQDKVFSLEDHEELAKLIPNAKLAIIEDSGHMSPMEGSQAVTNLLSHFITYL